MTSQENKLLRVSGPLTYRLMAVRFKDGDFIGETCEGRTLAHDIEIYKSKVCKPLYAVFVRPRSIWFTRP